jgi:hypothetical protein
MIRTALFYLLTVIVLFLAPYLGYGEYIHASKWIIISFFVATSYLHHTFVNLGMRDDRSKFIEFYLISFTIKLILTLLFIGIILFAGVENRQLFVINFFVLYLFLTVFEINNILRKLRRFS